MKPLKIFDAHVHPNGGPSRYDLKVSGRNLIFNTIEAYRKRKPTQAGDSISLIFDYRDHMDFVLSELGAGWVNAIKIHSRLQGITEADYPQLIENLKRAPSALPIIIDAFY